MGLECQRGRGVWRQGGRASVGGCGVPQAQAQEAGLGRKTLYPTLWGCWSRGGELVGELLLHLGGGRRPLASFLADRVQFLLEACQADSAHGDRGRSVCGQVTPTPAEARSWARVHTECPVDTQSQKSRSRPCPPHRSRVGTGACVAGQAALSQTSPWPCHPAPHSGGCPGGRGSARNSMPLSHASRLLIKGSFCPRPKIPTPRPTYIHTSIHTCIDMLHTHLQIYTLIHTLIDRHTLTHIHT